MPIDFDEYLDDLPAHKRNKVLEAMGESVLDKVIIESPGIVSWFIRIVAFVLALMWACVVTPIALIFLVLCLPIGVALLYIGTAPLVMTIKWFFHKKIRIAG